jgi:hypothetical protein
VFDGDATEIDDVRGYQHAEVADGVCLQP